MIKRLLAGAIASALFASVALAQVYPTSNPAYTPTAVLAPVTASAPATPTFQVNGLSTVSVRVTGTCTALAMAAQVTNTRTGSPTWTTVPMFPVGGGASITSASAVGFWTFNVGGMTQARLNVSALSASCTFAMAGGAGSPTGGLASAASQFPTGAAAITGNAAGTTGAVVGTLAAATAKTTYICGFNAQAIGGTAAVGPVTVAGLVGSSMVFQASSSAAGGTVARETFNPCVPASAVNTAITVTTTADGTATAVNVNSWGYQQ